MEIFLEKGQLIALGGEGAHGPDEFLDGQISVRIAVLIGEPQ
jgi:hypothetical protein